jgi:hypothetical protein
MKVKYSSSNLPKFASRSEILIGHSPQRQLLLAMDLPI